VKFGNQEEAQKAIVEMQGKYLLTKPMKLNYAAQKKGDAGVTGANQVSGPSNYGGNGGNQMGSGYNQGYGGGGP
jgi:RNA recognition motif-containing protein